MTPERTLAILHRAGLDAVDAGSRAALLQDAHAGFTPTGNEPQWGFFVPGRIEVFGKHTDYAGGRSLVAAVPRGIAVVAGPRAESHVRVFDARRQTVVDIDLTQPERAYAGWPAYVTAVIRRLTRNFPGAEFGADIAIASDLPRAAGLSSSSALIIAIASTLIARANIRARPEWVASIRTPLDEAAYVSGMESGSSFGVLAGQGGVGTQGGSQDHTAILASQVDQLQMFRYMPVECLGRVSMPREWRFVVMTSGVHASKMGSVRDKYNHLSQLARALVEVWNRRTGANLATLAAVLDADPLAGQQLRHWAGMDARGSDGDLALRLAHFIDEDARVPIALEAFATGDRARLGELGDASVGAAHGQLRNQVPETRELARTARLAGAFAASTFGAGFGGSVWALVNGARFDAEQFAERWRRAYLDACPHIERNEWFTAAPGPGVVDLSDALRG